MNKKKLTEFLIQMFPNETFEIKPLIKVYQLDIPEVPNILYFGKFSISQYAYLGKIAIPFDYNTNIVFSSFRNAEEEVQLFIGYQIIFKNAIDTKKLVELYY